MKADVLQKALSALGLCKKAGGAVYGTEIVCDEMRKTQNLLLVIAPEDNSENTKKKLADKCGFYRIALRDELYDIVNVDHMNYKKKLLKFSCRKVRR